MNKTGGQEYLSIPVPDIDNASIRLAAMLREVLDDSQCSQQEKEVVLSFIKQAMVQERCFGERDNQ